MDRFTRLRVCLAVAMTVVAGACAADGRADRVGETSGGAIGSGGESVGDGRDPACSAAGLTLSPIDDGIPQVVEATRLAIARAAVACDYEELEALTGEDFTSSFGGGDAATFWRTEEDAGRPVLATLVAILDQPVTSSPDGSWLWPRLAAGDADGTELDALVRSMGVDPDDWFYEGSYVGPRVGIAGDGVWEYYVAGD